MCLFFLIEVFETIILPRMYGMLPQIVICPMGDTLKFAESGVGEGKTVFHITAACAFFSIMCQLLLSLFAEP